MDDLGVVEAQRFVAEAGGRGIPHPIAVPERVCAVILFAVRLEDDSPGDDEVDAADPDDVDLAVESKAEEMKPQPQE